MYCLVLLLDGRDEYEYFVRLEDGKFGLRISKYESDAKMFKVERDALITKSVLKSSILVPRIRKIKLVELCSG